MREKNRERDGGFKQVVGEEMRFEQVKKGNLEECLWIRIKK